MMFGATPDAILLSCILVLALYGFLVRPQLRRAAAHQAFVESLKIGDRVVTSGGLIGRIDRCDEAVVSILFGSVGHIDVLRTSVHGFAPPASTNQADS